MAQQENLKAYELLKWPKCPESTKK